MKQRLPSDAGVALATVLVMVSILSALAVVVVETGRFSALRTANQTRMEQAHWHLIGAESHAVSRIADLNRADPALRPDQEEWQGRDFVYPLDDGAMTLRLRDGANCFNLNSLVDRDDNGRLIASARGQVQFARLLDLLDIRAPFGIVAALVDWLDSDQQLSSGGMEDGALGARPYRTADTLLGDRSELLRVRGFTPEIVHALAPYACVRPTASPNVLNINTILPDQAPVLALTLGPDLPLSAVREMIRARPRRGWDDVDSFLGQPRFAGLEISESLRAQLATRSSYYVLNTRVANADFAEDSIALIDAGAAPYVVRRILGAGGWEYAL